MTAIFKGYSIFALIAAITIGLYSILVEKVLWKQITLLTCGICLLPYTSTDYKLLHFFLPFVVYLNTDNKNDRLDLIYLILFCLVLMPKTYFYLRGDPFSNLNGIINTLCMIGFIFLIVKSNKIKIYFWKKRAT